MSLMVIHELVFIDFGIFDYDMKLTINGRYFLGKLTSRKYVLALSRLTHLPK